MTIKRAVEPCRQTPHRWPATIRRTLAIGYNCFSSGHKFCREVCPGNAGDPKRESHADRVHGQHHQRWTAACLRHRGRGRRTLRALRAVWSMRNSCPNTLFVGDFYQARTETVKVVRAARALLVDKGLDRDGWKRWNRLTRDLTNEPVLGTTRAGGARGSGIRCATGQGAQHPDRRRDHHVFRLRGGVLPDLQHWAARPGAAEGGSRVRADERTVVLWRAGRGNGLCEDSPARSGARQRNRLARIGNQSGDVVIEPHDYIHFTEDYPAYFGASSTSRSSRSWSWSRISSRASWPWTGRSTRPSPGTMGMTGRRSTLTRRPGSSSIRFRAYVLKTSTAPPSGRTARAAAVVLPIEKPEITAEISRTRLARARELGVDMLVSACVVGTATCHAGHDVGIEVADIIELVAESAGIDIGGRRGASELEATRSPSRLFAHWTTPSSPISKPSSTKPGSVLTNISSRSNRVRVPAPFPVHRWGEYVPAAVVLPRTAQQVSEIVRLANRAGIPVVPRAGVIRLNDGAVPLRGGIIVDVKRMNEIKEVDLADRCVTVGPGIEHDEAERGTEQIRCLSPGYARVLPMLTRRRPNRLQRVLVAGHAFWAHPRSGDVVRDRAADRRDHPRRRRGRQEDPQVLDGLPPQAPVHGPSGHPGHRHRGDTGDRSQTRGRVRGILRLRRLFEGTPHGVSHRHLRHSPPSPAPYCSTRRRSSTCGATTRHLSPCRHG